MKRRHGPTSIIKAGRQRNGGSKHDRNLHLSSLFNVGSNWRKDQRPRCRPSEQERRHDHQSLMTNRIHEKYVNISWLHEGWKHRISKRSSTGMRFRHRRAGTAPVRFVRRRLHTGPQTIVGTLPLSISRTFSYPRRAM